MPLEVLKAAVLLEARRKSDGHRCFDINYALSLPDSAHAGAQVPAGELLVQVAVYSGRTDGHTARPRREAEFAMLGRQTLAELRDQIRCCSDQLAPARRHMGFFFIGDTFYNDLRHPDAEDSASRIRSWLLLHGGLDFPALQLGDSMADTRLGALTVQLNFPYLYSHQGNCEHLIVFTDARLHNPDHDPKAISAFPHRVFQVVSTGKKKRRERRRRRRRGRRRKR